MLQVINHFRPYTDSVEGCLQIGHAIESVSKLRINGIVGNSNLIDDTLPAHVYEGYEFVKQVSEAKKAPLEFITVSAESISKMDLSRISCPVLTVDRQLVPPWEKAVSMWV
jgi:hypothetical protein